MLTFAEKAGLYYEDINTNSSPRKNGNISKMLETMKQEIEYCNAEAVYVKCRS